MQDSNYARLTKEAKAQNDLACPIKEAKANDLARLIKEAKALDIKGINSKNTIIVDILEGSLIEGNSCTIRRIDYTASRNKDWIKAKKANRAKLRD